MKVNYKQLIQSKGHMPTGVFDQGFPLDLIAKFLENTLESDELVLDVTGVRFQGKNSFLVLTSARVICVHFKPGVVSGKNFKVFMILGYADISRLLLAPRDGIIIEGKDNSFNMYFIQPEKGKGFSESLKNLGIDVERLVTIPPDRHEKALHFQVIVGFILIIGLFGSCTYNAITNPASTTPLTKAEIEACLRKYVRGDTVEKREIEEAYRKCTP
jgi:hypothetical protein